MFIINDGIMSASSKIPVDLELQTLSTYGFELNTSASSSSISIFGWKEREKSKMVSK